MAMAAVQNGVDEVDVRSLYFRWNSYLTVVYAASAHFLFSFIFLLNSH